MILNFTKNQKELVEKGIKKIYILKDETNYWKKYSPITFVYGFMTNQMEKFKSTKVKNVDLIEIKDKKVFVNGNLLNDEGLVNLISLDGHKETKDFFEVYSNNYEGIILWW
jgi:hypothetical protein